jgi:hypothetical protein
MTKAEALKAAEHNARYRHGEWFVWTDTRGEWNVSKRSIVTALRDAAEQVDPASHIYLCGGGGPHSMSYSRFSPNILPMWVRNAEIGY